jgi:hypothetical protein
VSLDADLESLIPGKALVCMYHVLAREIFVLSDGFEITMTEQRVLDTPFYTQTRSKLLYSKGRRFCFLGLQFGKMTVPVYTSPVYRNLSALDTPSSRVLVQSSQSDFSFLCTACDVEASALNTAAHLCLCYILQAPQQVLLTFLDMSSHECSELAKHLVQILLSCVWNTSLNRLRLRYAEGHMRSVSPNDLNMNTPDELKHGHCSEYTDAHWKDMVKNLAPPSKKAKVAEVAFKDNEEADISAHAEDLDAYFKLERGRLGELDTPREEETHASGTWKITKLSAKSMTLKKITCRAQEYRTAVAQNQILEVYKLVKAYEI